MSEVIGVFDGGRKKIKHKGQFVDVNVIIFRTQQNESAPIDHIGYYSVFLKKSIINALNNIHWLQPEPPKEEMVKLERNPKDDAQQGEYPVIPAEAGIQEEAQP